MQRSEAPAPLTVLMPCRNGLPFLDEAIDSVLAAPQLLELLVADGGSSDGSLELLQRRAAQDPRLRLVSRADRGVADGLNRAFQQARGTVIGWLNADDRYLPGAPGRALAALQEHPHWLLVYGEGEHIDAQGTLLEPYPTRPAAVGLEGFRDHCFLCQPTVFWRRSLGVMLGPFDTGLQTAFDFDYWLRAFAAFPERIGHLPCRQAQTRLHAGTLSSTRLPRAVLEATLLQARTFADARPHILQAYLRQIEAGSLPLPDGFSRRQHGEELLAMARSLPMPARQQAAIEALLAPWLLPAAGGAGSVECRPAPVGSGSPSLAVASGEPVHRDCVLVLGTHRSGTSALAGCLSRLGCEPPQSLIAACDTNPRGFYESQRVHDLNEEILAFLGSHWSSTTVLPLHRLSSPQAAPLQRQALELLRRDFPGSGPVVLKDPRLTRLLPFWLPALAAAGYRPCAVLIHRHPLEVARSLQQRNRFSLEHGQRLWLVSVLEAERASRRLRRSFMSYDQLLRQAPAVFGRIGRELQLSWPAAASSAGRAAAAAQIEAFISSDLRHHHAGRDPEARHASLRSRGASGSALRPAAQDPGSALADWIDQTRRILERLAWGHPRREDRAALDRIHRLLIGAMASSQDPEAGAGTGADG